VADLAADGPDRIAEDGGRRAAIGLVFGAMLIGFALMFLRALQVAWKHWRQGYSVLERPDVLEDDKA